MCLHAFNTPYKHKCCIQIKTFQAQIITKEADNVEVKHLKNPSFHPHDVTQDQECGLQLLPIMD